MKKYSLRTIILVSFLILTIITLAVIYFFINQHKEELIETAIEEKTHLAETINETIASPVWIYRLALVPGMEGAFLNEMAGFKDVIYIRVVSSDGTIFKTNIEKEWGEIIKDPDISKVIRTRKEIVKDQIFKGEKIKLVIYPGYQDKTIWVGFSLEGVEGQIKWMWIRDLTAIGGGLLLMVLILFLIVEHSIIYPFKTILSACQEIRKGNLDVKIKTPSKTEIGEFAAIFNQTIEDLRKSRKALEESKTVLEIKVEARTKELEELAESLDEKVKERTKELQGRVNELERFHRLTVGRELKMIELKKEVKRLREELEKT